ncbi:type I restriction endonuclease [Thiocapsa sp.]|nr:type I restriction endonuclease [Thiocapsa sp.]
MPFGPNHEHVTVRLIDFEDLEQNQYVVTTQYLFRAGPAERRADPVLLINGFPLILIEAKTPVRPAVSWVDAALQIHENYEQFIPELFACNVFSVATEGKELRFGSIRMPINLWGPGGWTRTPRPGVSAICSGRSRACWTRPRCSISSPTSPCSPPTRKSAG